VSEAAALPKLAAGVYNHCMNLRRLQSSGILAVILAASLPLGSACKQEKREEPSSRLPPPESTPAPVVKTNTPPKPLTRLEWNVKTTVAAYRTGGYAGSAWDQPATAALDAFASLRSDSTATNAGWREIIATNCNLAANAGCHDPLIGYLRVRTTESRDLDEASLAENLIDAATRLQPSSYPAVHKFYATLYAVETSASAFAPEERQQKTKALADPSEYLAEILNDPQIPVEEAYEVCDRILQVYEDIAEASRYKAIYHALERPLLRRWPKDYRTWLTKGEAYINLAWIYRGGGTADTVSREGFKGFNDSLATAQQALEQGWKFNQSNTAIPLKMMTVALGGCGGKTRDLMELWFHRAMIVDSNCLAACRSKLYFLEPKWHGSDDFQLAFGRECVESPQWGGRVPLMLVEVHEGIARRLEEDERKDYWKQPRVWLDVQEAFERYISLNPGETNAYAGYVIYAVRSQRWDKVKELLPKFGPEEYSRFGGADQYNKLVQRANELAPKTPAVQLTLMIDAQRSMARLVNRLDQWMNDQQADEAFKTYESVVDKYPNASNAERARVFLNEAIVCSQFDIMFDRARQLCLRIKKEFPQTSAARDADRMLADLAAKANTPAGGPR
jgi:tetratricopeptide (TPR) repeat protein